MIFAGTLADLDFLSGLFGPSAFLSWSGGPLHSIAGAIAIGLLVGILIRTYAQSRGVVLSGALWWLAPICAALLHVGMDGLLSSGVTLLWPISTKRIALDWAPGFDLWILILLVIGLFLPELFRLVSDEIGAKSKKPRGHAGAIVAIGLIAAYIVLRGFLHSSATMAMLERSYASESPRRAAAFPDSLSPFVWHGIVETESALHLVQVPTSRLTNFDPESAVHIHKPELSSILDSAQKAGAARQFLATARFPKATVQPETDGSSVELRDLMYDALGKDSWAVVAEINLNKTSQITSAQLEWQNRPRKN